ncbi:MAG: ATP-binding cassette domain-containing protein [Acidimicrobiales bacterium]
MSAVIDVHGLVKRYGSLTAVDGIDLTVEAGEIVAVLGPNGAGKSTTVEILEGFRSRDAGSVSVLGLDPADAPRSWYEDVGVVPQETTAIPGLTARETLAMYAGYYRAPRPVDEVLDLVGLSSDGARRASRLSGGQRRRLDLGLALIGNPKLVFLDEPTTGFDPSARRGSWAMIDGLRSTGSTVLLTTHYMDEADVLADRIVVIAAGRVVASGTAADLAQVVDARPAIRWRRFRDHPGLPGRLGARPDGESMVITTTDVTGTLHQLTSWAIDGGHQLADLTVQRPTLEDVYLALVSGDDDGAGPAGEPAISGGDPLGGRRRGRSRRRRAAR